MINNQHERDSERLWGRDKVATALVEITRQMEHLGETEMGDISYNEAIAFHALTRRVRALACKMAPALMDGGGQS
jgi:hypothetical protein